MNTFIAPPITPSLPATDGPPPKSWKRERIYTAVKTCECCGNPYRPRIKRNAEGKITSYTTETNWNKQRFCSISCFNMLENPMFKQESREKVAAAFAGIRPHKRIHNVLTSTQKTLRKSLGRGWKTEHAILTTEKQRKQGAPMTYKVDLGEPTQKIAIELDGKSHLSLKCREEDKRKMRHLAESGWKVLRLSNSKALSLSTISK